MLRTPVSRARYSRDENTGVVAAGASEQQEQHELEEERAVPRGRTAAGGKDGGRAQEERIEEEIPSESSRCDPV